VTAQDDGQVVWQFPFPSVGVVLTMQEHRDVIPPNVSAALTRVMLHLAQQTGQVRT
jgi:hypothetical protein